MAKLVSKVYGDALFEAALEENQLDAVWDEVREIASILQENEAFIDIMNHPEMTCLEVSIFFLPTVFFPVRSAQFRG